jgi:hypothetical protein
MYKAEGAEHRSRKRRGRKPRRRVGERGVVDRT